MIKRIRSIFIRRAIKEIEKETNGFGYKRRREGEGYSLGSLKSIKEHIHSFYPCYTFEDVKNNRHLIEFKTCGCKLSD